MAANTEFWFHHAGVSVLDLDAQIEWYSRVLGFRVLRRKFVPVIPAEIAILHNGPLHLELFRVAEPKPASPERSVPDEDVQTTGNKHVAFCCDDVRGVVAVLRDRGADIVWVREIVPGVPTAYIKDPEGNLIEFVQLGRPRVNWGDLDNPA